MEGGKKRKVELGEEEDAGGIGGDTGKHDEHKGTVTK